MGQTKNKLIAIDDAILGHHISAMNVIENALKKEAKREYCPVCGPMCSLNDQGRVMVSSDCDNCDYCRTTPEEK